MIFNNFSCGIGHENRNYDIMDPAVLKKHVSEALREYNENNAEMPLVLFEDAMKHVCRITRIIMSPSGHAAMIGVGGMGKQSLSRLGAYILGYTAYQIVLSTTYKMNDLKQNI